VYKKKVSLGDITKKLDRAGWLYVNCSLSLRERVGVRDKRSSYLRYVPN